MVVEDKEREKEKEVEAVRVAVRVRPLVESERVKGCEECLQVFPEAAQLRIKEFAFTYNHVFGPEVGQASFYEEAVSNLVNKLFKGYNVTILAYGQTGSGKTYSMGTAYDGEEDAGVIPQAVSDIFHFIDGHEREFDFKVSVSFIELYQEQVYDLLSAKSRDKSVIDIREDGRGIILPGLTEEKVFSAEETMACLMRGSSGRATGATAMNAVSSRSHAVFTVCVVKECKLDKNNMTTSKFHLVDLAGSERSKKTKATGDRFREGVKINRGLLALGNVISALGDENNKGFICYRDSKLTRLLRDSLGGNSVTLMIACVSPADYNLEETLSTLRYADRAKRIKNKPIINQDAKAAEIINLKNEIQLLRLQILGQGGPTTGDRSELVQELQRIKIENADLKERHDRLVEKNRNLNNLLQKSLADHTNMVEKALDAEMAKEKVERKLAELNEEFNRTVDNLNTDGTSSKTEALNSICEMMKTRILDLTMEQKLCGQRIAEIVHENTDDNDNMDVDEDYVTCKSGPDFNEFDFQERQEAHTNEQVSRNKQFKNLLDSLKLKESLAEKLSANNMNLLTCSRDLKEFQDKIVKLEAEKETLHQQLKAKSKLDPKVVSERQHKIQELEIEINNLRKKCQNQENLLKMKEKNESKIEMLRSEIQQMKAAKVKLLNSMKAENTRFRTWKLQKERQLAKLTDQDRKRQTEMIRMENRHAKQQNVLKRKLEEAIAASKRLKEAADKHKNAQKQRGVQNSGKVESIQNWVEQELELMGSLIAAQSTLEGLMEDRGVLTAELEELKTKNPENKKAISQLQEEVQLRSAQIADMQQKILDSEQENKSKMKWDTVQSMVEAKFALKYLFEVAAETKREIQKNIYKNQNMHIKYEEMVENHKDLEEKLQEKENEIKQNEYSYKKSLSEIERNYEEKVHTLTKQLNSGLSKKSDVNEELENRLVIIQELYEKILENNEQLRKENEEIQAKWEIMNSNTKRAALNQRKVVKSHASFFDDDDNGDSDNKNDPDWYIPIVKPQIVKRVPSRSKNDESQATKRTSDGLPKCSCKTSCATAKCGCKKVGNSCSNRCKCNETCINKETSQSDAPASISADVSDKENDSGNVITNNVKPKLNETFKFPRHLEESNVTQMRKKSFFYGEDRDD